LRERYDEERVQNLARDLRKELGGAITFALAFCGDSYFQAGEDFFEIMRIEGHIGTLAGCSAQGIIHEEAEYQNKDGLSVIGFSMNDVQLHAVPYTQETMGNLEAFGRGGAWAPMSEKPRFAVTLMNPFLIDMEHWFRQWNSGHLSKIPMTGGLASSELPAPHACVFLNEEIIEGGVTLFFGGGIRLETVVSQGCRPIGEPMTITQADENILYSLGTASAYEILTHAIESLPERIKSRARGNLFVGLAMDEYQEDFKQGDFLIRNILAADPQSGAVAVGARLRVGQTLQYQIRDPAAASEELARMLHEKSEAMKGTSPVAGLLFSCNGRGIYLFGNPGHDSLLIKGFFPTVPLAGFFCNGEIGPVRGHNYLHGYTASLGLILEDSREVSG
jgi:small ligand-binding sensory domain FIST